MASRSVCPSVHRNSPPGCTVGVCAAKFCCDLLLSSSMDERTLRPTPGGPTARMVRESLGVRNKRRLQQVGPLAAQYLLKDSWRCCAAPRCARKMRRSTGLCSVYVNSIVRQCQPTIGLAAR